MSARIGKVKEKLVLRENSFDGSADSEFISLMTEDGSLGSGEENSPLAPQAYLESNDNTDPIEYKEISNVTYKIVPVVETQEETITSMQSSPSHGTYYFINNPVEVFATNSPSSKIKREETRTIRSPPPQPSKASSAKKRDDKRRVTHNEVERRRRCKINTWIMKLATLVPDTGMPDAASKGGILAKACDHIVDLNEKQKRLDKLEEDNEKLVMEVIRLNQELSELRKENNSMRNQLADNCIVYQNRPKEEKL